MHIRDLYERMHRFRLICRVNHIHCFTSQRGTPCHKLVLIDETGDEIVCMLYEKPQEKLSKKQAFVKGKCYVFENGEVRSDEGGLSLTVQWSGVTELQRFLPSFAPGKMLRLGQVAQEASFFIGKAIDLDGDCPEPKRPKVISVCGIFKGFKEEPKLAKTLFRVVGLLCDPDHELAIQFSLLVDELAGFPEEGCAVSLHNVLSVEDDRTLRLESTKKSYILNETGNAHEYFADLLRCSASKSWKLHEYRNLSEVAFVPRTVAELKALLARMMEHDTAYSEIEYFLLTQLHHRQPHRAQVLQLLLGLPQGSPGKRRHVRLLPQLQAERQGRQARAVRPRNPGRFRLAGGLPLQRCNAGLREHPARGVHKAVQRRPRELRRALRLHADHNASEELPAGGRGGPQGRLRHAFQPQARAVGHKVDGDRGEDKVHALVMLYGPMPHIFVG